MNAGILGLTLLLLRCSLISSLGCSDVDSNGHIDIPEGTVLATNQFRSCNSLTSITLPGSVTVIPDDTFNSCKKLKSVTMGTNVETIGSSTFEGCTNLQSLTLPDSVRKIGFRAFAHCYSLESITIPNGVTEISNEAFKKCYNLQSVSLGENVIGINGDAFHKCKSLTSIKLPKSLERIEDSAFRQCSLKSLVLPPGVVRVGSMAFIGNSLMTSLLMEKTEKYVAIGESAFALCLSLSNVTILSKYIDFAPNVFSSDVTASLRTIYFSKSTTHIEGLPAKFYMAYHCNDTNVCGCEEGYENLQPSSSSVFSCTACMPGFSNDVVPHRGLCTPCMPGSYAEKSASDVCELCAPGTYGIDMIATSASTCELCAPRYYSPAPGMAKCMRCPSGSECPSNGTSEYTRCAVGRYNSFEGQLECIDCPRGKYGPNRGSAICLDCPLGTYLNDTGARTPEACMNCCAGRFGSSDGSSLCPQCPKGYYQSLDGQSECVECKDEGNQLVTNAPDFKSCEVYKILSTGSPSIVERLFTNNVAYYVSFSVSAIFVALCGIAARMMWGSVKNDQPQRDDEGEKEAGSGVEQPEPQYNLGQLSPFQVLIKAGIPGFSFGSEVILIIGIYSEMPALAIVMLLFRLVHIVATMFLVTVLFGSKSTRQYLSSSGSVALQEAVSWSDLFHYRFARANIFVIGVILILCATDISLVQMLPWDDTAFFKKSKGFPSKSLMRFALGADMIQASVSALCTIIFIASVMSKNAKNATTSPESRVFFGLNIASSLLTVLMSFVLLYLRESLLKMTAAAVVTAADDRKRGSASVELSSVYRDGADGDQGNGGGSGEHVATLPPCTHISFSNPMHSATSTFIQDLQQENDKLREENGRNTRQIGIMAREIKILSVRDDERI